MEKSADKGINDQDDPFKDLAAEETEETINEFCERLPDEVPEELMQLFCWISMLNYQQMEINQVMLKSWQKYEGKLSRKKMILMLFMMNR